MSIQCYKYFDGLSRSLEFSSFQFRTRCGHGQAIIMNHGDNYGRLLFCFFSSCLLICDFIELKIVYGRVENALNVVEVETYLGKYSWNLRTSNGS